jgi:membrane fusion protein (multidrug efflux system)
MEEQTTPETPPASTGGAPTGPEGGSLPPAQVGAPASGQPPAAPPAAPKPPIPPKPGFRPPPPRTVPRPPRPGGPAAPGADRKKIIKYGLVGLATALAIWGLFKFIGHFTSKAEKETKKTGAETSAVNVMEVKLDKFQDVLSAVGTIAGGSEIPLRFETEGTIDYFEFREGDKVRKGDLISRLSQRDVYLKLKKAELELDQYEKLYAFGGVARGRLEEARVQADLARSELEKTMMRAPRDGIIGDKDAEVGEYVTPSKRVATLVNIESVLVRVGIIEKEIDKIFPGQKVVLTVDAYSGVEFTGRVETISPMGQGNSKTFTVDARADNEGGLLLPGMFARTRITIFEEDNTIAVPNDSVEKTQAGARVFIVTKENKAQARDVTVGYVSSQFSQITKGLEAGELVVTQKPQDLKDGQPVKVIEVQK